MYSLYFVIDVRAVENGTLRCRGFCGEGACSRRAAQRSQNPGSATHSSGSKLPNHIGLFVVRENASRWCVFCVVYPRRGARNVLLKRELQRKRLSHPLNRLVGEVFPASRSRKAAGQSGLRRAFSAVRPVLVRGGQTGPWGRPGPVPVPVRCPRPAPWPRPARNAGRSSLRWQNPPSRTG